MFAPKKILVPTDFSEQSDMALKKALDIAYQYKSTIYLLHVIDVKLYNWSFLIGGGFCVADILREEENIDMAYARKMLQEQMGLYVLAKKVEIIPTIRFGIPRGIIMQEQEERGIDLMVIGSKKKKGLIRQFIGTMAYHIVGSSALPSLVVHA